MTDSLVLPDELRDQPRPQDRPRRRWHHHPVLVLVPIVLLAAGVVVARPLVTGRHDATPAMPRPPVLGAARDVYNGDLGDPFVLAVTTGGRVTSFVAFGTGDWPARVPTAHSTDLTTWQAGPDAMPTLPPWATPDPKNSLSWAPAVLNTGGGYILYVTLPDARSGQQCIAAAGSTVADGPYVALGNGPLLCQHDLGGSIDPAVVRDHSGHLHILWKNDGNSVGAPSSLWEQGLTADGRRLVGAAHRLLSADQSWQGGIVEEPAVIAATGGGWWLFYSGNAFDKPEYATGLAFCPALEGPCRDVGNGPLLTTAALNQQNQFAPGGLETFRDSHGGLWAVFDTWNRPPRNGRFYCCRSLQLAPFASS